MSPAMMVCGPRKEPVNSAIYLPTGKGLSMRSMLPKAATPATDLANVLCCVPKPSQKPSIWSKSS